MLMKIHAKITIIVVENREPYYFITNNGVFIAIFTYRRVACEDAGPAAYSQLHLHVTGEYNCQQAGIVVKSQNIVVVTKKPLMCRISHYHFIARMGQ